MLGLIGSEHAAVAADSLLVVGGSEPVPAVRSCYSKVFRDRDRIAAMSGVILIDGDDLGRTLYDALSCASEVDEVFPLFLARARDRLEKAALWWAEQQGPDASSFAALVAGRRGDGRLQAYELSIGTSGASLNLLSPDGDRAYGAPYGAVDGELRRWSSVYRLEQAIALFSGAPLGPRLLSVPAGAGRGTLADVVRFVVESAAEREALLPRPESWPEGLPVAAGPVQAVAI